MFHNKWLLCVLLVAGCSLIRAATDVQLSEAVKEVDNVEKHTTTIPTTTPTTTTQKPSTDSTITTSTALPSTSDSTTTDSPTTSSTTSSTTTSSSTTSSTTTSSPTTSSSTTSTTSTSTTPATTSTTSSTPPITSTSTTAAPTPKPQPYPEPSVGHWNSSCIMIKMATQLNFTYATKDKNVTATALYNIPANATFEDSVCANTSQNIQINWGPSNAVSSMLLQFDSKNNTFVLAMLRFLIPIVGDRFPNAAENKTMQLLHLGNELVTPSKMSYHCTRVQYFNLTESLGSQVVGTVKISDVQVEAFLGPDKAEFSEVHDCDSSSTPDVVPIAVGIALIAMIAIILISYLVARRRSNSRGYMSF